MLMNNYFVVIYFKNIKKKNLLAVLQNFKQVIDNNKNKIYIHADISLIVVINEEIEQPLNNLLFFTVPENKFNDNADIKDIKAEE